MGQTAPLWRCPCHVRFTQNTRRLSGTARHQAPLPWNSRNLISLCSMLKFWIIEGSVLARARARASQVRQGPCIFNCWNLASWRADCPAITALRATKQRQRETDLQSAGVAAVAGLFVFALPVAPSASITICPRATKSTLRGEVRRQARPMVRPGSGAVKRSNFTR
jgi:hypothetical protein